ncbi:MFS transporter [Ramlibacter sp.]|uniref:MFS transporter n=1 Tax=Ramlibacter sp. TaxID=1917967 RepID=UPI003D09F4B3
MPPNSTPAIPLRIIIAVVLSHAAFIGCRFVLTLHAVALGAAPGEVGLVLGVLMLGPMLLSVQYGRWADRWGYARLSGFSIATVCVGGIAAAMASSLPVLYVASALVGTGYMLAYVSVVNAIARLTPSAEMTRAFAVLSIGFSFSPLAGPVVGGWVIDHYGHRAAYLTMLVSTLASGAQFWWASRRYVLPPPPAASHARRRVWDLFRYPDLRAVFIVGGMLSIGVDTFTLLAPLQGVAAGLSATAVGITVGAFSVGSIAIRAALPWMSRRIGDWRIVMLALFVTAAGFAVYPFLHHLWLLCAASAVLGMTLGASAPLAMTLITGNAPAERVGEALGLRAAIASAGQALVPMFLGGIGTAVGLGPVFWCGALLMAAGGFVATRRT